MCWKFKGDEIYSKIYTILCSCDSVARCKLQNIIQFNGYYGCSWCEHKGVSVEKGHGRVMSYTLQGRDDSSSSRTQSSFFNAAKQAVERGVPVLGVKGPSILNLLNNFNIISGFITDYMHCVCLGIARQFTMLWCVNSTSNDDFHLTSQQQSDMSKVMCSIMTPTVIKRKPRSLEYIKYWKATEWLYWLLFYSPIILLNYFTKKLYNHWLLLVASMHLLLQSSVTEQQLVTVEYMLTKFVIDIDKLYGSQHVSYNVHLLMHISDCVRNWGMVWNYSNFMFENYNGILKKYVYSSQKAAHQIAQRFLTFQYIKNSYSANNFFYSVAGEMFDSLNRGFNFNSLKCNGLVIGKSSILDDKLVLQHFAAFTGKNCEKVFSFKRIFHKNLYIPKGLEHSNNKKSANCIVINKEQQYAVLKFLVSVRKKPILSEIYSIVNIIHCSRKPVFKLRNINYSFSALKKVENDARDNIAVWSLTDIVKMGVSINNCVVAIPESLERDY